MCSLTLFWPNGKSYTNQNIVKGKIAEKPKGYKEDLDMIQFLYLMDIKKLLDKWSQSSKILLTIDQRHSQK